MNTMRQQLVDAEHTLNPLRSRAKLNDADDTADLIDTTAAQLDDNARALTISGGALVASLGAAALAIGTTFIPAFGGVAIASTGGAFIIGTGGLTGGGISITAFGSGTLIAVSGATIVSVLAAATVFLAGLGAALIISVYREAATDARRALDPEITKVENARDAFNNGPAGPGTLSAAFSNLNQVLSELQKDPTP